MIHFFFLPPGYLWIRPRSRCSSRHTRRDGWSFVTASPAAGRPLCVRPQRFWGGHVSTLVFQLHLCLLWLLTLTRRPFRPSARLARARFRQESRLWVTYGNAFGAQLFAAWDCPPTHPSAKGRCGTFQCASTSLVVGFHFVACICSSAHREPQRCKPLASWAH